MSFTIARNQILEEVVTALTAQTTEIRNPQEAIAIVQSLRQAPPPRGILTPRQKQIYNYIVTYRQETNGLSPSTREIATHFGMSSQTGAMRHLTSLRRLGWISHKPGAARSAIPL